MVALLDGAERSGLNLIRAVEYSVMLLTARFYKESHEGRSLSVWHPDRCLEGAGGRKTWCPPSLFGPFACLAGRRRVRARPPSLAVGYTVSKPRQSHCQRGGRVSVGSKTVLGRETRGWEVFCGFFCFFVFSGPRVSETAS